jgi:hypothetical protein
MNINWRGEIVLCCNDYFAKAVMGTVQGEGIKGTWEGKKFEHYRRKLLRNDRVDLPLCDVCDFDGGSRLHLLKKSWSELL